MLLQQFIQRVGQLLSGIYMVVELALCWDSSFCTGKDSMKDAFQLLYFWKLRTKPWNDQADELHAEYLVFITEFWRNIGELPIQQLVRK